MIHRADVQKAVNEFEGVLRLEPSWVPRSFMIPGRRLKLHTDDLYAFGAHRGGIWCAGGGAVWIVRADHVGAVAD